MIKTRPSPSTHSVPVCSVVSSQISCCRSESAGLLVVTHSRSHETPCRKMIFRGNKIIFDKAWCAVFTEGDIKEVNKY